MEKSYEQRLNRFNLNAAQKEKYVNVFNRMQSARAKAKEVAEKLSKCTTVEELDAGDSGGRHRVKVRRQAAFRHVAADEMEPRLGAMVLRRVEECVGLHGRQCSRRQQQRACADRSFHFCLAFI